MARGNQTDVIKEDQMGLDGALKKAAPLTGITFGFLYLLGTYMVLKEAPDFAAKAAEIMPYFADQAANILAGTLLVFISTPFWFSFLGVLHNAVKAKEGPTGRLATTLVASGSAAAAITLVGEACAAAGAIRARNGTLTSGVATVYFDASYALVYTATAVAVAAFLFALAIASLRYEAVMPKWLGAVSLVLAGVFLIPNVAWIALPIGVLIMIYASIRLYSEQADESKGAYHA